MTGVGGVTVLVSFWLVAGMVSAGQHSTVPPPMATAVQQPTNKQLVCSLAQGASLLETLVAGPGSNPDPADTSALARQLGTNAPEVARLVGRGGPEVTDLTAIGTDAAALETDVLAHPASNVAGDASRLQVDITALQTDAGC